MSLLPAAVATWALAGLSIHVPTSEVRSPLRVPVVRPGSSNSFEVGDHVADASVARYSAAFGAPAIATGAV